MVFDIAIILNPKKLGVILTYLQTSIEKEGKVEINISIEDFLIFHENHGSKNGNPIGIFLWELQKLRIINSHYRAEDQDILELKKNDGYTDDLIELYMNYGGRYYIDFNKEKIDLLISILTHKANYVCHLRTIEYLVRLENRINIDDLANFLALDKAHTFNNLQILLHSIATTDLLKVAKAFYFSLKLMTDNEKEYFSLLIDDEDNIGLEDRGRYFTDQYKVFYFNGGGITLEKDLFLNESSGEVFHKNILIGKIQLNTQPYYFFSLLYKNYNKNVSHQETVEYIKNITKSVDSKMKIQETLSSYCSNLKNKLSEKITPYIQTTKGGYMLTNKKNKR